MNASNNTAQPWVIWLEGSNYRFGHAQEYMETLTDLAQPTVNGLNNAQPLFVVVSQYYHGVFDFLQQELDNTSAIFNGHGPFPQSNWLSRMAAAAARVFYRVNGGNSTNDLKHSDICFFMGKACLDPMELGWNHSRRIVDARAVQSGAASFTPTWYRHLRQHLHDQWEDILNRVPFPDAAMITHAVVLCIVQEKTELSERFHGRLNQASIAESFANAVARVNPSLYAEYIFGMFRDGVYGRDSFVLPVITEESD